VNVKSILITAGLIAVPAWYTYRTATDGDFGRLVWNEMSSNTGWKEWFMTGEERIQNEVAKRSEIGRYSKRDDQLQACVDWATKIEAQFQALTNEQKRWEDIDNLVSSDARAAIAEDSRYLGLFRQFLESPVPEKSLSEWTTTIRDSKATCSIRLHDRNPVDLTTIAFELTTVEESIRDQFKRLTHGRKKIGELVLYVTGGLPPNLDGAIRKQRIESALRNGSYEEK
jgi:hypothetical protein